MRYIGYDPATGIKTPAPAPTVLAPELQPYYELPNTNPPGNPRPMLVKGFIFDPATRTFDFSGVPEFDLSRLQSLRHSKTRSVLYVRPLPAWNALTLAEVDGVSVPPHPTTGKMLVVKVDTSAMLASDEILAAYDLPLGFVPRGYSA